MISQYLSALEKLHLSSVEPAWLQTLPHVHWTRYLHWDSWRYSVLILGDVVCMSPCFSSNNDPELMVGDIY